MDVEPQMDPNAAAWAKYDQNFPPLSAAAAAANSEVHIVFDVSDADDNSGACFLCPLCHVEIEVRTINGHLEEEHCFDMKNAVCPVCAASYERDLIAHIMIQHTHLLKRRKFHKFGSSTNGLAGLSKDLEKLLLFLGVSSNNSRTIIDDPDIEEPISSDVPTIQGYPKANPDTVSRSTPNSSTSKSDIGTWDRNQLQRKEMIQRAEFCQNLIVSTIF